MNLLFLQVFYAFFSGVLEALSISNEILPFGSPVIGLFCLAPLYRALYSARTYKAAFLIMAVQTLTVHLISSFWLANFHGFAVFTLGASAFGTMLLGGLCGIVIYLLPKRHNALFLFYEEGGKHPYASSARIVWFAASIVFWEWIKSTGFLAYPWGTLFMASYRWKIFTQIADITGVWGLSFLFALFSAVFAEGTMLIGRLSHAQNGSVMVHSYKYAAACMITFFALSAIYGCYQYFIPRQSTKQLNTIIVQQNIDPWEAGDEASIGISMRLTEEKVTEMKENGLTPDLVLWSEGVLNNRTFPAGRFYYSEFPHEESLTAFIKRMNVPFIIGGTTIANLQKHHLENSAILFDKRGTYAGFYSKIHLVPFAEQIPLAENPLMMWFMKDVVKMASSLRPGKQYVLFKIPLSFAVGENTPLEYNKAPYSIIPLNAQGIADPNITEQYISNSQENPKSFAFVTTPICFEDAFSDVCQKLYRMGSEVFLNITNDSWSKTPSSEYQHFIVASFRAIEYRTTLVRCANSGYSVVVDPSGRILHDLPVFEEGAIACAVPLYERKTTLFSLWGDWFAYLLFALMAVYAVCALYKIHTENAGENTIHFIRIQITMNHTGGYTNRESVVSTDEAPLAAEELTPAQAQSPEYAHIIEEKNENAHENQPQEPPPRVRRTKTATTRKDAPQPAKEESPKTRRTKTAVTEPATTPQKRTRRTTASAQGDKKTKTVKMSEKPLEQEAALTVQSKRRTTARAQDTAPEPKKRTTAKRSKVAAESE